MADKFVIDAGPFIHLAQIGRLPILTRLPFIAVPTGVLAELSDPRLRSLIQSWPSVQVVTPGTGTTSRLKKYSLDKGETECLDWALSHAKCIFLTDDLAARKAAKDLRIEVHGSVGVILFATRRRWMTRQQAEESLNLLHQQSSLFITDAIIENAIHALRTMK